MVNIKIVASESREDVETSHMVADLDFDQFSVTSPRPCGRRRDVESLEIGPINGPSFVREGQSRFRPQQGRVTSRINSNYLLLRVVQHYFNIIFPATLLFAYGAQNHSVQNLKKTFN